MNPQSYEGVEKKEFFLCFMANAGLEFKAY